MTDMWIQMEDKHFEEFIKLRTANKAQPEMRELAETMEILI